MKNKVASDKSGTAGYNNSHKSSFSAVHPYICRLRLVEATNFVKTIEQHQHRKIACLEEIAYLNGWISKEDVLEVYELLKKNQYGQYLKDVLDGKYMAVLH